VRVQASISLETIRQSGRAPNAGERSGIPAGVYSFIGEARNLIVGMTPAERQQIAAAIQAARQAPEAREAVTEALASSPALSGLAQLLIPHDAAAFWALIAVLVTLFGGRGESQTVVYDHRTTIVQQAAPAQARPQKPARTKRRKTGKHKRHGRPRR
jgi:hypothetical protein